MIRVSGKKKSLGRFVNEDAAGRAYDAAIRKYYPDEKPHKWKGYNFTADDGEKGSDDGDDTRSARGASSSSAAAIDESEEEEEEASSAEEERPCRRRRRWKTSPTMPARVMVVNKAFCACLPEKLRAKYEKLDAEEEARARRLRLVVPSRMALATPTSR